MPTEAPAELGPACSQLEWSYTNMVACQPNWFGFTDKHAAGSRAVETLLKVPLD